MARDFQMNTGGVTETRALAVIEINRDVGFATRHAADYRAAAARAGCPIFPAADEFFLSFGEVRLSGNERLTLLQTAEPVDTSLDWITSQAPESRQQMCERFASNHRERICLVGHTPGACWGPADLFVTDSGRVIVHTDSGLFELGEDPWAGLVTLVTRRTARPIG